MKKTQLLALLCGIVSALTTTQAQDAKRRDGVQAVNRNQRNQVIKPCVSTTG